MKMITSEKHYLTPFSYTLMLIICALMFSVNAYAKVNVSHLFIQISDAMEEVKQGEVQKAQPILEAFQQQFVNVENYQSVAGKQVQQALEVTRKAPDLTNLEQLSKALVTFEKEQNPVDLAQQRAVFAKRVMPVYKKLDQAVQKQDLTAIKTAFKGFVNAWIRNEVPVRENSLSHYRKIETAMFLIRSAIETDPVNYAEIQKQSAILGEALRDYKSGKNLKSK